jgi:hypothetical protein
VDTSDFRFGPPAHVNRAGGFEVARLACLVEQDAALGGLEAFEVVDELAGRREPGVDLRRDHDLPHHAGIVLSQLTTMRGHVDQRFLAVTVWNGDRPLAHAAALR